MARSLGEPIAFDPRDDRTGTADDDDDDDERDGLSEPIERPRDRLICPDGIRRLHGVPERRPIGSESTANHP